MTCSLNSDSLRSSLYIPEPQSYPINMDSFPWGRSHLLKQSEMALKLIILACYDMLLHATVLQYMLLRSARRTSFGLNLLRPAVVFLPQLRCQPHQAVSQKKGELASNRWGSWVAKVATNHRFRDFANALRSTPDFACFQNG